jgi:nicotinate phosphoribosyltransferase
VYKLAFANGKPRIKLSENMQKITLPHKKQVYRIINDSDTFYGADVISVADEKNITMMYHPAQPDKSLSVAGFRQEPLLDLVMKKGKGVQTERSLKDISGYCMLRLSQLPLEYKRFDNPHIYKVGLSGVLRDLRNELKNQYQK